MIKGRKWLFLVLFLISGPLLAEPGGACRAWFAETGISPGDSACRAACVSARVGLGSYNCPRYCSELCSSRSCESEECLDKYEDVVGRESSLEQGEAGKGQQVFFWPLGIIGDGIKEGLSLKMKSPIPVVLLENIPNAIKMASDDEYEKLEGAIDMHLSAVFGWAPSETRKQLKNLFMGTLTALDGIGRVQQQDVKARNQVKESTRQESDRADDSVNSIGLDDYNKSADSD